MSRSYAPVRMTVRSVAGIALVLIGVQLSALARGADARHGEGASVRGVAWNSDNSPIPSAKVRLRNTQSGRVEANSITAGDGQFAFDPVEGGSYVVELVGDNDKVMAVGQSFRVEAGEAVATFVRLPPRRRFAGVLSNTATAVIAAAASVGVTALGPGPSGKGPAATTTGSRPISPQ
jgi:hypothetical protein